MTTPPIPIVCDMTTAPDTLQERLDQYRAVFATLIERERTDTGIRFRLCNDADLEVRVRRLAQLEKECCAFFDFSVTRHDDEIHWDASVVDDPVARELLDQYFELPITVHGPTTALYDDFVATGAAVVINDNGTMRPATPTEIGVTD